MLLAGLAACGDGSKTCGPGTTEVDGVCTGAGAGTCSDGTILVDDHCEIDPNACQGGTVLMGGQCVDPGAQTATIEEATEPNALGIGGEDSADTAGTIMLKPVGEHFTIHGKIKPFQDSDGDGQNDADFDTYDITVNGPTMLEVTVDGVNGLAGGFVALANAAGDDPLATWTRFGVNPTGDTAKRQMYLPAAGTYFIAIADSRSLFLTGSAPGAGMGQPDMEYYATIDQVTATPTALTPTAGVASSQGQKAPGEVKLFSVTMGEGINDASLTVDIDQVQESLVVANTHSGASAVRAVADGDAPDAGDPAAATVLGIHANDSQIIAVDSVFDYANSAYDYDLEVTIRSAGALSTNGGMVSQPSDDIDFSTFYYDVAADGLVTGMDVAFNRPVSGVIIDENFFIFSRFTFGSTGFSSSTFTTYKGLIKHVEPGRYYFLTFDPVGGAADITATSTYAGLQATAVTKGTPLTNQMTSAYGSTPFSYTSLAATAPWQLFNASGTGTGAVTGTFYLPAAKGRLDTLTLSPTCSACNDAPAAAFTHSYAENGSTARGRILIDDNTASYFLKVRTATAGTFTVDFKDQTYTDLGALTPTTGASRNDQALDGTVTVQRYLLRTTAGNQLTAVVHPDQLTLNTQIQPLNADESNRGTAINNGAIGADDTWAAVQAGSWSAFTVTAPLTTVVNGTFDLSASVLSPKTYTKAAGTTAFADACTGGTTVDLSDVDGDPDTDESRSGIISAPASFKFFGFTASQFRVFANGFISFDTAVACPGTCYYNNPDMPNTATPNALIAPYWDDLDVEVCQKTIGTKLVVQWTGFNYNTLDDVEFQAILDGATGTIEFVYGAGHTDDASGATIGLESWSGNQTSKVSYNTAAGNAPTLFTPM